MSTNETSLQIAIEGQQGAGTTPAGTPGPPGPQGRPGPAGATQEGDPGEDGFPIPGPPGIRGLKGDQGYPGSDGEPGDDAVVIPGPAGRTGLQGFQGAPGQDGEDGQDGIPMNLGYGLAGATSVTAPASPTAPNSTSAFTMQGLAGSITPRRSGNILVSIAGTVTAAGATTVDNGIAIQGSYGTGTAPISNAALTGTQAGAVQVFTWPIAPTAVGDVNYGFNVVFLISVAQLGTTLWLDLAAKAITTVSDAPLANVVITAIEI